MKTSRNRPVKRKIEITQREVEQWAYELAWKRAGFENYDKLKQTVRALSTEEKIDLMVEAFLPELCEEFFNKKGKFLRTLGHKTWVDSDEIFEHAVNTYMSGDDVEFRIDRLDFYPVEIDEDLKFTQLNVIGMNRRLKETKRK